MLRRRYKSRDSVAKYSPRAERARSHGLARHSRPGGVPRRGTRADSRRSCPSATSRGSAVGTRTASRTTRRFDRPRRTGATRSPPRAGSRRSGRRNTAAAGCRPMEQFIFRQEMALADAPGVGGQGTRQLGPTLIVHGSPEQKAEHLPKILNGEVNWRQGYSEPGSGSDLASLQTRAVRDGDDYVINGQKIWTSGRALRRLALRPRAHRPRRAEAPRHLVPARRQEDARHQHPPADQHGLGARLQRDVLRGRPRAGVATASARRTAAGTSARRCSTSSGRTSTEPSRPAARSTSCSTT